MRSWLVALAAAAILLTACEAGTIPIDPTIQYRTPTATATPPRRVVLSAASDGVRPTDTPTPTATRIPATATPVPYVAPTPRPYAAPVAAAAAAGDWTAIVCSVPWPCGQALSVMQCESSGNPNATDYLSGYHHGLFQVGGGSFDPATNVRQAYLLYLEGVRIGNPWYHWNQFGGCGRF